MNPPPDNIPPPKTGALGVGAGPDLSASATERREWRLAGIIFFGLLTLVLLWAAAVIVRPFITAILLGAIVVTLTFSAFRRVRTRMNEKSGRAAAVMLIAITLLVVIPLTIVGILLVQQANTVFERLQSGDAQQMLRRIDITSRLQWIRRLAPKFDPATLSPDRLLLPAVRLVPAWVASHGAAVVGGIAGIVLEFALVLLSAYFFYFYGEAFVEQLALLSPLPARYDREFADKFKETIDATFRGQVSSALAQGVATGIGLAIADVPGSIFWGAVATILGLLPMVGAAIIWVPAAIYLFIDASMGHRGYWAPIFLTLWGLVVVSLIDNIVRPWVMKGRSELPAIPLLFSVLGGLQAFGFVGLVIGPLVFSLLMTIVDIYKRTFKVKAITS
ncbi:MAG TPA: AI-2E family transporter [Thermoanaerobaculia bacterium]|nr:AI-2E family transporter [Thermoanaerobaculia bacterium]